MNDQIERTPAMGSPIRPDATAERREEFRVMFAAQVVAADNHKKQSHVDGIPALLRLYDIATQYGYESHHQIIAKFLLGCYNGMRFPFDLTELRGLDLTNFFDCIAVLEMDHRPTQEVHLYFENGGAKFEKLAQDWGLSTPIKEKKDGSNIKILDLFDSIP